MKLSKQQVDFSNQVKLSQTTESDAMVLKGGSRCRIAHPKYGSTMGNRTKTSSRRDEVLIRSCLSSGTCVVAIAIVWLGAVTTVVNGVPTGANNSRTDGNVNGSSARVTGTGGKKVLLILLDGFRWDYPMKYGDLIGFNRLRNEGVKAEYILPGFPSMTLPNLYSIATGLHPENHGILDNYMYDRKRKKYFENGPMKTDMKDSIWWEGAEPIWITATKAGLRAHVYLWPGCQSAIKGLKPDYCMEYYEVFAAFKFRENVYDIVDKFEKDVADLGMLYVESADFVGHFFGPETQMMSLAVHDLDSVIDLLINRLKKKGLQEKVNVIVMSDHGMVQTDMATVKKIRLSDYLNLDDIQMFLDGGPIVGIIAANSNLIGKVYDTLKSIRGLYVWLADEIPEEYHYKHNSRIPDIIVLAKRGYGLTPVVLSRKQKPYVPFPVPFDIMEGNHGYIADDFPDMRGILYGWGPDMLHDKMVPAVRTLDVYNLAVHLLGISPLANNGSWEAVKTMLKNEIQTASASAKLKATEEDEEIISE